MKLFYRETGSGEPVIVLHGLFGMSDNWMTVARKIGERYRVIIPDMRNHGRSPWAESMTYETLVQDVRELLNNLNLTTVRLIGHSMGGKTAMLFSLQYPEMVKQLVVVDMAPKTYRRPLFKEFIRQLLKIDLKGLSTRKEADERLAQTIKAEPIRQFLLKNLYRDDELRFQWRIHLQSLQDHLDNILRFPDIRKRSSVSALFLRGDQSDYITDADIPLIKRFFPQSELITIPNATHWLHADAPEALCEALKQFFNSTTD